MKTLFILPVWKLSLRFNQFNPFQESDFSICYLSPSYSRLRCTWNGSICYENNSFIHQFEHLDFDFSIPYTDDNIVFVTKAPTFTSTEGIFFLKPFTLFCWIALIAVYIIFNIFVTVTIKKTETVASFPTSWFLFGSLVKQSKIKVFVYPELILLTTRCIKGCKLIVISYIFILKAICAFRKSD